MAIIGEDELYTKIHRTTWKRRVTGMMAACTLGLALGAVIGAVAICLPWALGMMGAVSAAGSAFPALLGVNGIMHAAAVFGVFGGFMGSAIGAEVGANAGASVAEILNDRELDGKAPPDRAIAALAQSPEPKKGVGGYFNFKVALTAGLMFAAFGALALIAAPGLMAGSTLSLLGLGALAKLGGTAIVAGAPTFPYAALAAGSAIFGMFGMTIGVDAPRITARLSNFYAKLNTGKLFERSPEPTILHQRVVERSVEPESVVAPEVTEKRVITETSGVMETEAAPTRLFATEEKRPFDPKDLIAQREQRAVSTEAATGFAR